MRVVRSLEALHSATVSAVTIGNFDGVHLGHKKIIAELKNVSVRLCCQTVLVTFHPHPLSVLTSEGIKIITPLAFKESLLEREGIDLLVVLPFDGHVRFLEAQEFVRLLVERLRMKAVVVGEDFRFGRDRKGDLSMLAELGSSWGFELVVVDKVQVDGRRVGSQEIRKMLLNGDVERAWTFLGRPYEIHGRVVHGKKRGIGFRTANIVTDFDLIPKEGVYVTHFVVANERFPSVTNIGRNPTFGEHVLSIETHVLDFSRDLYGYEVKLFFLQRLRDEIAFRDVESLNAQIERDIEAARSVFRSLKEPWSK